jgi:SSS family solute:Na+ symporter
MQTVDWIIVAVYLAGMLALAAFVGAKQNSRKDYYLGGNTMSPLSLATSTIATQCSTNSLLGAPAFVGFVGGGGLIWLQYELAVPLAMLLLVYLLGTMRRSGHVSAYAFLEERLGTEARLLASTTFLVFRGVATGVTVYGVAVVVTLLVDVSYTQAVLLLMGVTIIYDVLGGMRAVVISDVLQMLLILAAVCFSLFLLADAVGGWQQILTFHADTQRLQALQFDSGLRGEGNYGFWPMLIGGGFLYMAYYGCDQSQAQRVLASRSAQDAQRVLLYNGLLRFPMVLLYCVLGLALGVYASIDANFVEALPLSELGTPNYNLVYPVYVLQSFPPVMVGLVMVGIFAAAMSSIDSALNSLSAATMEDYVNRSGRLSERAAFLASKFATLAWGLFAIAFSYQVESIAPTVLEAINKIGSIANGPLLALFLTALFLPGVGQRRAAMGFMAGFAANLLLWLFAPQISWLWWNVSGCLVSMLVTVIGSATPWQAPAAAPTSSTRAWLLGMTALIFCICLGFGIR